MSSNSKIKTLRVRAKAADFHGACAVQFATMLSCWAAKGDLRSQAECAQSSKALVECLKTAPKMSKAPKSNINYHLLQLAKLKRRANIPLP
ncbi:hypothetical protein [Phaffia rhodozyma]|uniref:37S ribosomal protein mrp10, mitochondrial n=1 Tax=Phaffia rhodozyma TaxID=264483 RepID=A0A0F7SW62_PHARH|nr:hypothetical protein [Phaffia rhodozyma]